MIDMNILKEFGITVLYVEDNQEIRTSTHAGMKLAITDIIVANDGQEGLTLFKENRHKIDLVISDINMPNLDGISMSKEIKAISPELPIIFTSAHNDSEYLIEAIDLGINAFVQKPLDIVVLLEQIIKTMMPIFQQKDLEIKQNTINNQISELEKFKEIIDEHSIVIKTDIEGKITYVNDRFCHISGYERDELLLHGSKLFKHPSNTNYFFSNLWKTILAKEPWKGVMKNLTKEKKIFYLSYSIFPILDEHKNLVEFYGIGTDVTHEKEYGIKMREMHKKIVHDKNTNISDIEEEHQKHIAELENQLKQAIDKGKGLENLLIKNKHESQKKIEQQKQTISGLTAKLKDINDNYTITKKRA